MSNSTRLADLPTWVLAQAAARSHRILHQELTTAGASGYEYRVLATLGELGQVSQADLGRAAGLDRRDVTDTVRKLEGRELVRRDANAADSRQMLVGLTAPGRQKLNELDAVIEHVQNEVFEDLGVDERRTLVDLLRALS